jgi:hypothetical protein
MHSLFQKVAMASISGFPMARHPNLNGPALIGLLVKHGADPNVVAPDCSRGIRAAAGAYTKVDDDLPLVSPLLSASYEPRSFNPLDLNRILFSADYSHHTRETYLREP